MSKSRKQSLINEINKLLKVFVDNNSEVDIYEKGSALTITITNDTLTFIKPHKIKHK